MMHHFSVWCNIAQKGQVAQSSAPLLRRILLFCYPRLPSSSLSLQAGWIRQERTDKTEQTGWNRQVETDKTEQTGWNRQDGTDRTKQTGRNRQERFINLEINIYVNS